MSQPDTQQATQPDTQQAADISGVPLAPAVLRGSAEAHAAIVAWHERQTTTDTEQAEPRETAKELPTS